MGQSYKAYKTIFIYTSFMYMWLPRFNTDELTASH